MHLPLFVSQQRLLLHVNTQSLLSEGMKCGFWPPHVHLTCEIHLKPEFLRNPIYVQKPVADGAGPPESCGTEGCEGGACVNLERSPSLTRSRRKRTPEQQHRWRPGSAVMEKWGSA